MAQSPERSLSEKVLRAHALAGKAHKDGAKPLTRLGGAVALGAIGVGGEMLVEIVRPTVFKKLGVEKLELHPLLNELLDDGLVGAIYTVANKNLGEALPPLKLRHLTTSSIGTMAVFGANAVRGNVGEKVSKWRESRKKPPIPPATEAPAPVAAAPQAPAQTTENKKSLLDYVNPVTALAADEARLAFVDWLEAYRAVSSGTEDEFVKTHTPKDEKEPSVIKETTIIYLGSDQQIASIAS